MHRRLIIGTGATAFVVLATLGSALCYSAFYVPSAHENVGHGMIAQSEFERRKLGYPAVVTPVPRKAKAVNLAAETPYPALVREPVPEVAEPAPPIAGDAHEVLADNERAVAETSPRYLPEDNERPVGPVSAVDVAGNPRLYEGYHVHWTCIISQVPDPSFANARCGPPVPSFAEPPLSNDELMNDPQAVRESLHAAARRLQRTQSALLHQAHIVLTGPVSSLDNGDIIVIDGTVRHPLRGQNLFGVSQSYPTVHIDSIIRHRWKGERIY